MGALAPFPTTPPKKYSRRGEKSVILRQARELRTSSVLGGTVSTKTVVFIKEKTQYKNPSTGLCTIGFIEGDFDLSGVLNTFLVALII
jgi:hypothetical protein